MFRELFVQLKKEIKIPVFESDNQDEIGRFNIAFHFLLSIIALNIILSVFFLIIGEYKNSAFAFFSLIISTFLFISLKKRKNHKLIFIIYNLSCCSLCFSAYFGNSNHFHFIELLWIINNLTLCFLTLDFKYVIALILIYVTGLSVFYYLYFDLELHYLKYHLFSLKDKIDIITNASIAFIVFIYFNWLNILIKKEASKKIIESSIKLKEQYHIIETQHIEKSIMLKEIHHRVKNNLQLIISILRLQAKDAKSKAIDIEFNETINRIIAISSIHEKLYQSNDLSRINQENYFTELIHELIHHQHKIDFSLYFDETIKTAQFNSTIPLALIINELVSNSTKHSDGKELTISIQFTSKVKNELILVFSDSGKWKEKSNKNTFGIELIQTLTSQLNGNVLIDIESSRFTFTFPDFF